MGILILRLSAFAPGSRMRMPQGPGVPAMKCDALISEP